MLYKQPALEKVEKAEILLHSLITGMEGRTISAEDAYQKLLQVKNLVNNIREIIQIEKEIM